MDIYTKLRVAVAAVLPLWGSFSSAVAGSVTQPGSTIGTTPGLPLAQGFYFSATPDEGVRDPNTRLFVIHPVYVWSTPWTVLGARFQVMAETAFNATHNAAIHANGYYNPLFASQLAWDLGNGLGFSYAFGAYFDVYQPLAWSSNSLNQRFALTYAGAGLNLSANMIYGIQLAGSRSHRRRGDPGAQRGGCSRAGRAGSRSLATAATHPVGASCRAAAFCWVGGKRRSIPSAWTNISDA